VRKKAKIRENMDKFDRTNKKSVIIEYIFCGGIYKWSNIYKPNPPLEVPKNR
jgi:hypothetical protein